MKKSFVPMLALVAVSIGMASYSLACDSLEPFASSSTGTLLVDNPCGDDDSCPQLLVCSAGVCRPTCDGADGEACNGLTRSGVCTAGLCLPTKSGSAMDYEAGAGNSSPAPTSILTGNLPTTYPSCAAATGSASGTATGTSFPNALPPPTRPTDCTAVQVKAISDACFADGHSDEGCTTARRQLDPTCRACLFDANGTRLSAVASYGTTQYLNPVYYSDGGIFPGGNTYIARSYVQYASCVALAFRRPDCQVSFARQQICTDYICDACTSESRESCAVAAVAACHFNFANYGSSSLSSEQATDGCPNLAFLSADVRAPCLGANEQATFELVATKLCTSPM